MIPQYASPSCLNSSQYPSNPKCNKMEGEREGEGIHDIFRAEEGEKTNGGSHTIRKMTVCKCIGPVVRTAKLINNIY